jgi:LPXTG-site transpeptidase (sortase) family protein
MYVDTNRRVRDLPGGPSDPLTRSLGDPDEEDFRPPRQQWNVRRLLVTASAILGAAILLLVCQRLVWATIHDARQLHGASQVKKSKAALTEGETLGIIQAADIELNEVFTEGSTVDNLRSGPTHRSGSGLPGEAGIMILDGHQTSYGGPFEKLTKLKPGSVVAVQARFGSIIPYVVKDTRAVKKQSDLIEKPTAGVARLVLVTASDSWSGSPLQMVIAEATSVLPASDASTNPKTDVPPQSPLRWSTLAALATVGILPSLWRYLRCQVGRPQAVGLVLPVALLGVVQLLMAIDRMLPRLW